MYLLAPKNSQKNIVCQNPAGNLQKFKMNPWIFKIAGMEMQTLHNDCGSNCHGGCHAWGQYANEIKMKVKIIFTWNKQMWHVDKFGNVILWVKRIWAPLGVLTDTLRMYNWGFILWKYWEMQLSNYTKLVKAKSYLYTNSFTIAEQMQ